MRPSLGPRAQAGLVLALVATLGALLGIIGDRIVAAQRYDPAPVNLAAPPPRGGGPPFGRGAAPRYAERLSERLDLSAAQRAAIDTILAEQQARVREINRRFQPEFRAIADETRARVEHVLTPEQRERLRTMRRAGRP